MIEAFLLRAGLAGIGVALAAGPLGCFVVWRRMAYFGDATAHAAILGVALALAIELPLELGTLVMALSMALAVGWLDRRGQASDTSLGVLSHTALAAGLVALSLLPSVRIDLMALLQGDILTLGWGDVALIWGGAALVLGLLAWRWEALLTATLSPDLAISAGIEPDREARILTLALAVAVALAIKLVGVLLIAAMLIIPAAAARGWSATPERMALLAAAIGVASALAGLAASWHLDTPAGPSIICAAALIFAVSLPGRRA